MPGFDWSRWAQPQGIDRTGYVILSQPSFFKGFAALIDDDADRDVEGVAARTAADRRARPTSRPRSRTRGSSSSAAC